SNGAIKWNNPQPQVGTAYNLKVFRSDTNHTLYMQVNFSQPPVGNGHTSFDPLNPPHTSWPNMNAEWYGEVFNRHSDMPGTNSQAPRYFVWAEAMSSFPAMR
ncbi:MAG TPA: hypothetical protein VGA30_05210, partial [Actinomycetota bacterium]